MVDAIKILLPYILGAIAIILTGRLMLWELNHLTKQLEKEGLKLKDSEREANRVKSATTISLWGTFIGIGVFVVGTADVLQNIGSENIENVVVPLILALIGATLSLFAHYRFFFTVEKVLRDSAKPPDTHKS